MTSVAPRTLHSARAPLSAVIVDRDPSLARFSLVSKKLSVSVLSEGKTVVSRRDPSGLYH